MDRFDAMTAFVAVIDEHGLAAAARKLGRSPAAITRAVAFLEQHTGARLLHRTTRSLHLTEAGERFAASCRRILAEMDSAELLAAGERAQPRGLLTVTAPVMFGRIRVRPYVDRLLDQYPDLQARLQLVDRVVNLINEGIDVAVRLGELADSNLIAVQVGAVRKVLCASPAYLEHAPPLEVPSDLTAHRCISFSGVGPSETWTFASGRKGQPLVPVRLRPRLIVNTADASISSAIEGHGIARVLSYQIEDDLKSGRLVLVLENFEPAVLPVHIVYPEARLAAAKTRAFIDMIVPGLREELRQPLHSGL